ncbi:MAG: ribosome biogenesis GTPase Der [Acidimicrobiia bacterium]|nr:ribosome biogenesis GTPase Der [Acidimicrobiia bacterium]
MSSLPVVAVVGRPNVGKSTLVNRILGRKEAVVDERAGVTRDRREFVTDWNGRSFVVVDTGGWESLPEDALDTGIRDQAETAIGAADLVVFVADARATLSDDDQGVARLLLRAGVPFVFVANKVDGPVQEAELDGMWGLGLGAPTPVSAISGRGVGDFLDALVAGLPESETGGSETDDVARLAIIGRPNVGKSTLLNRLAGEERVLVSDVPGTTRDPIDLMVEIDGEPIRVIDTAGIKRRTRITDDVEYFAVLRSRGVIQRADVVLFLIDGTEGATHQEQRLAEEVADAGAGIVVVLNKWDVITPEEREHTNDSVADRLGFVSWAPVIRISAKSGARTHRLGPAIHAVLEARRRRIPTPELNRRVRAWQDAHPPPVRKGRRPHVVYAVQAGTEPPTVILFVRGGELGDDYLRFLERRIREEYDFLGTPIRVVARTRKKRYGR